MERVPPLEGVAEQFRDQYTKLRIWELDQYDKLIYLDADTLVVGDINDLFTVPHDFAAVGTSSRILGSSRLPWDSRAGERSFAAYHGPSPQKSPGASALTSGPLEAAL